LWYIGADRRLPAAFRTAIEDGANEVYLSAASLWEAAIKQSLGKLSLPKSPANFLQQQREAHGILSLPIDETAVTHLIGLPPLHRDPFDRILIAQASQHSLTLVTMDDAIRAYPVVMLPKN
jgi:PIN domain nuclease of toxin-antitoxin system